MKILGFGCGALGLLLGLGGLAAVAAVGAGAVNGAEEGTALSIGGGLCCSAFLPLLVGVALVVMGRKKPEASE
jgi:hypothetical protein